MRCNFLCIIITLTLLRGIIDNVNAQNLLYFQGFESSSCPNIDNWEFTGGNVNNETAYAGSNSARVGRNGESNTLTFNSINVTGYSNLQLSIYHKVRTGSGPGMDTREGAFISVNLNSSGWTVIGRVGGFGDANWDWGVLGGAGTASSGCNIYQMNNPLVYNVPAGTTTIQVRIGSIRQNDCSSYNNAMDSGSPTSNYDRTDEGFFIDNVSLTTSSHVPAMPGCPTSVSLTYFKGYSLDYEAAVQWATASEKNNAGFDIEKSSDAVIFTKIGFIQGAGNSVIYNTYTFYDTNFDGSAYYRLRQIDYDGSFSYSNTIFIDNENKTSLTLYPVPAQNCLTVEFVSHVENHVTLTIENHFGELVKSEIVLAKVGFNSFTTRLSELQSGIYILRIFTVDDSFIKKFVKN